jgi:hypothetical protein
VKVSAPIVICTTSEATASLIVGLPGLSEGSLASSFIDSSWLSVKLRSAAIVFSIQDFYILLETYMQ